MHMHQSSFECSLSNEDARKQAHLLRALADSHRLRIIAMLRQHRGTMTVNDIVDTLGYITQATVSHHLRVLRDAGLVDYRKDGLNIYYYVQHAALTEAYSAIYRERVQEKSA